MRSSLFWAVTLAMFWNNLPFPSFLDCSTTEDRTVVMEGFWPILLTRIDSRWRPNSRWRFWFRLDELGILSGWNILLIEVSGREVGILSGWSIWGHPVYVRYYSKVVRWFLHVLYDIIKSGFVCQFWIILLKRNDSEWRSAFNTLNHVFCQGGIYY